MLLYHGTSMHRWKEFLIHGIRPRTLSGTSIFGDNPHPEGVYLTTIMAPYYALAAWLDNQLADVPILEHCFIVEVDALKLDSSKFAPDDDFLAHKFGKKVVKNNDLRYRIVEKHRELWIESLITTTQIAYLVAAWLFKKQRMGRF